MILRRAAEERGHTKWDWLDSWHSFSFGDYVDPQFMGFATLRVINDDVIAPAHGFPTHPHRDMEILTVVLEGELAHRDSTGSSGVIRPGDVQLMHAGTGIQHSEVNPSSDRSVHLLQIWIRPRERNLAPGYQQKRFDRPTDTLVPIVTPDGRDGSLVIFQDASVYQVSLSAGGRAEHRLASGRRAWVQVARGAATVNGVELGQGDGAAIEAEPALVLASEDQAELLVFDMG